MRVRTVLVLAVALAVTAAPLAPARAATGLVPLHTPRDAAHARALLLRERAAVSADIVNGVAVAHGTHPATALVVFFDPDTLLPTADCTGTLIMPTWVLTAGHCAHGQRAALVALDLDDVAATTDADVHFADAMAVAPGYDHTTLRDDAALLRLEAPSRVTPVAVAGTPDDDRFLGGAPATIVGWGLRDDAGSTTDVLRAGDITLLNPDACYAFYGGEFDHAGTLCGAGRTSNTCFGDSGGPLLVDDDGWLLLGVTSFGGPNCTPTDPSGFTRVAHVRPWLQQLTALPDRPGAPRFADLTRSERHFDAVLTLVSAGIADGAGDGMFQPARAVTRAQMASFLARGLDLEAAGPPAFDDVAAGHAHAAAIAAVAGAGIASGSGDGRFQPGAPLTRAQMATFLARAFDLHAADATPFTDVAPSSVHAGAIAAVARAGITTGFADGSFRPDAPVSRAQMTAFLGRALDLLVLTP